jgi:hypothetical protein
MAAMDWHDRQIERLRHWRRSRVGDGGLEFIAEQFKRQVDRPHRQLTQLIEHWQALVPAELAERSALRSFSRGTLHVIVTDSATLYQLDRQLRSGLEGELRSRCKATLRKVKLQVGTTD